MSKSRDYWRRRFEMLLEAELHKSETYLEDLEKAYLRTMSEIEKDIAKWYNRFAKNNEITLSEARRLLKTDELREFRWTVEEYIKYGEQNAINQQWMKQLENASSRVHISRFESLRLQLQQHVETLYEGQIEGVEQLMTEAYQSAYYHTAFEIQKAFEVGFTMQALNEGVLTKVISKPWTIDGMTFSERIWRDRQLLIDTLHKELIQSIARGQAPGKVISVIQKKLNTSRSNAARLVMTESAFFASAGQKDAYNELDVERYEIVATLDLKTSAICQELDGKVFKMSEYEVGVTANPFHPNCRTATSPFFDDNYGERIARDLDGETYYVASNMTYKEWYQQQVEKYGDEKITLAKKQQKNESTDRNQHERYKKVLGKDVPKSFSAFQNMKYNDKERYKQLMKAYRSK